MKIRKQDGPPEDLIYFDEDLNLTQNNVEDVVEIFNTPLTGSYNWDYSISDNRIKKLYELGKELNWNGSIDLNWEYTHPKDEFFMQADEDLHAGQANASGAEELETPTKKVMEVTAKIMTSSSAYI